MKVKNKKWEFIADIIIHEIEQDHYKKDEKLPSENQMAEQFGCRAPISARCTDV